MPVVVTDAIVLHAFDYLESSRILRLATREAGVMSVLARGARRPKSRFGGGLDLFTEGVAEIAMRPGRDLQTLSGFDITRRRSDIAENLDRFTGCSALAEMALRFAGEETAPALFDTLGAALDAVAAAPSARAAETALAGAWRVVADLGFAPALDRCAECHTELDVAGAARFSHSSGGTLCDRCGAAAGRERTLPPTARATLRAWLDADRGLPELPLEPAEIRAHQRLLREFLHWHVGDGRELRAFAMWEGETLGP